MLEVCEADPRHQCNARLPHQLGRVRPRSISRDAKGLELIGGPSRYRHNVKVISAAIVLGVNLLQTANSEEDATSRTLIDSALQQTEAFAGVSVSRRLHASFTPKLATSDGGCARIQSVCRKGGGVVRFLLQKLDEDAAQREQPRRSKRSRTTEYDLNEGRPLQNLSNAFAGFENTPAHTDDDAEPRRRRVVRPPLPHSMSDTNVPARSSASPELAVRMSPSLSSGVRAQVANSAPTTPSESSFPQYSTAPVGRQIAGLGRSGFGQARSKLSGQHPGLSIEMPSPMAAQGHPLHRGPISISPPQYHMNLHLGSTTPAGPPPSGDGSNMFPFFPLPPRHEHSMASGLAAGTADYDFLGETDIDRHDFA